MSLAAFVVSVVALLVAGASVAYSRTQAKAGEAMARHDRERRHEERTPRLSATSRVDGSWQRIGIALDGPEDLDALVLRQLPPRLNEADTGCLVDTADGRRLNEVQLGPVVVGMQVAARYQVNSDANRGTLARFHAVCRLGDDIWTIPVEVEYPNSTVWAY